MRAIVERVTEQVQKEIAAKGYFAPRPAHVNLMAHVPIEGIRPSQLAARMQVSKQAVDQMLDQLEQGGAIERQPDPRDRRARLVKPTAWALEAFLIAGGIIAEIEDEWRALVGDGAFTTVEQAFELMRWRDAL
jgi:DNA-binding MarR family transcriptional regulator